MPGHITGMAQRATGVCTSGLQRSGSRLADQLPWWCQFTEPSGASAGLVCGEQTILAPKRNAVFHQRSMCQVLSDMGQKFATDDPTKDSQKLLSSPAHCRTSANKLTHAHAVKRCRDKIASWEAVGRKGERFEVECAPSRMRFEPRKRASRRITSRA